MTKTKQKKRKTPSREEHLHGQRHFFFIIICFFFFLWKSHIHKRSVKHYVPVFAMTFCPFYAPLPPLGWIHFWGQTATCKLHLPAKCNSIQMTFIRVPLEERESLMQAFALQASSSCSKLSSSASSTTERPLSLSFFKRSVFTQIVPPGFHLHVQVLIKGRNAISAFSCPFTTFEGEMDIFLSWSHDALNTGGHTQCVILSYYMSSLFSAKRSIYMSAMYTLSFKVFCRPWL